MDNYFTSIPLAEDLLKKKKISIIGTLRKNKREIPIELIQVKQRAPGSSMFAFKKGMTLVSYVPKKNRVVLALSTMHEDDSIDVTTEKPEIITAYNNTKCDVDLLDQMCSQYSVCRNSRRWPLTVFFNLMDVSAINALIIFSHNRSLCDDQFKITRRLFLHDLARSLIKPQVLRRIGNGRIPRHIRERGARLFVSDLTDSNYPQTSPSSRGRCHICPLAKNRTSRQACDICKRNACGEHLVISKICTDLQ